MAIIRAVAVPLLTVIALFSLIGMSLAASLVAHYDVWQGSLGGWTKSLLSLFVLTLAACFAFIPGLVLAAKLFGNLLLISAVWGFLWILGLISCIGIDVALDDNNCSIFSLRRSRCSMFATMEAFAWMTWISITLYLVLLGYSTWKGKDRM